jgi:hypothetical protein
MDVVVIKDEAKRMKKKEAVSSPETKKYSKEIAWFVTHRRADVIKVIRGFKRLTRGKRGERGPTVALFVSALEAELKMQKKLKK